VVGEPTRPAKRKNISGALKALTIDYCGAGSACWTADVADPPSRRLSILNGLFEFFVFL